MKYLQDDDLARWTAALSSELPGVSSSLNSSSSSRQTSTGSTNTTTGRRLHGRLEAYSMKRAGNDKQYAQSLGKKFVEQIHQDQQLLAVLKKSQQASSSNKDKKQQLHHRRSQSAGNLLDDAHLKSGPKREVSQEYKEDAAAGETIAAAQKKEAGEEETIPAAEDAEDAEVEPCPKKRTRAVSFDTGIAAAPLRKRQQHSTTSKPSSNQEQILAAAASISLSRSRNQTALGDFTEQATRRLMTDLILTLNASFPDYDFSSIQPSDFVAVSVPAAVRRINERLAEWAVASGGGDDNNNSSRNIHNLWTAVDKSIRLTECQVYLYQPTDGDSGDADGAGNNATLLEDAWMEDDDDEDDETAMVVADSDDERNGMPASRSPPIALWSFYYLLVNKNLKRILLFSCVETMKRQSQNAGYYSSYAASGGGNGTDYDNDMLNNGDEEEVDYYGNVDAADTQDYIDLDPEAPTAGGIPVSSV